MWGAYITGTYPRSSELIEATRTYSDDLQEIYKEDKKKAIELQQKMGLSYISAPKQDWDDMFRPFCINGIKVGSLDRIYETNTFYKTPIINKKIKSNKGEILKSLTTDLFSKKKPWKVDLPDPYTFASLSNNNFYKDRRELVLDIAEMMSKEISRIVDAGCRLIQLIGPAIPLSKDNNELDDAFEGIKRITKGLSAKTYLYINHNDASNIFSELQDCKVDGIGIDFTVTKPIKLKKLKGINGITCGLLDVHNTRMEKPKEIAKLVKAITKEIQPKETYLTSTGDLEGLPLEFANKKVEIMGNTLKILKEERNK